MGWGLPCEPIGGLPLGQDGERHAHGTESPRGWTDLRQWPWPSPPRKAARYLDEGHNAIYQLLGQGRIRSVKLGRRQ